MNRRNAILAGLGTPLLASCSNLVEPGYQKEQASLLAKNTGFANNPGIDRERASFVLEQAGLDALVMHQPDNIYYSTGYWGSLLRAGLTDSTFAIIPKEVKSPVIFLCSQFTYYYSIADIDLAAGVEPYLTTWEKDNQAADALFFAAEESEFTAKEKLRRDKTLERKPFYASSAKGLQAVCRELGITSGKLGYDSLEAMQLLEQALPLCSKVQAVDVIKHLRLIKTPREIALMQIASANNVEAALATASKMRQLGSSVNVRNQFLAEAAARGNHYEFMVVNSSINQQYDEELKDGTSVLIDCVSSYMGYYGDYGRSVFIGEPRKQMGEQVQAMGKAWNELKTQLAPGMKFSEIQQRGTEILKKINPSIRVSFGPHSVGLAHTEQPKTALDGSRMDIQLERGMIISVDCPLMQTSAMGSAHLEDLTLITDTGSKPIHDAGHQIIVA